MKKILIATDFSAASQNATAYAVSLAQSLDASVCLVNAVAPQVIIEDSMLASVMVTQAELVAKSDVMMKDELEALSKKYSIKIKGWVKEGYASEVINKMAEVTDADLIIMGMKGKGKSVSIFGSTTTSVIRKSTYPVFVIPEDAVYQPITAITLASDFDSEIKLDRYIVLSALAEKYNSQINILNVEKIHSAMTRDKVIGKMQTSVAFSQHHFQFHTVNENNVEEGINKFIEKNHTDILAMVAHKHSLFDRLFGKIHTKSMSYQTQIPLLVLQGK